MAVLFFVFLMTVFTSCKGNDYQTITPVSTESVFQTGAQQIDFYLPKLKNKRVACVVNNTSTLDGKHLIDTLLALGVDIKKIFAPEHGFRGEAANGEKVDNSKDPDSGLPIISLYGSHKKPTLDDLEGIDLVLFDIQDVGARFYTYIYTMAYVMESCAESDLEMMVLDRPNPNGHYIDGPMMEPEFTSFIGLHPIPTVYGMTIGEYAIMTNEEGWLKDRMQCKLEVIEMAGYVRDSLYVLPAKPSPNLPNSRAVLLYPSLCFFEGTNVSVGRGTDKQFQVFGSPGMRGDFTFIPRPKSGAGQPFLEGELCTGTDLTMKNSEEIFEEHRLNLSYLLEAYQDFKSKDKSFFLKNGFFEKLAGTKSLRSQIEAGWSEEKIRESWQPDLEKFKALRAKYLLYP